MLRNLQFYQKQKLRAFIIKIDMTMKEVNFEKLAVN